MSNPLRSKIIRLAHANPELRPHLLPLIRRTKEAGPPIPGRRPRLEKRILEDDVVILRDGSEWWAMEDAHPIKGKPGPIPGWGETYGFMAKAQSPGKRDRLITTADEIKEVNRGGFRVPVRWASTTKRAEVPGYYPSPTLVKEIAKGVRHAFARGMKTVDWGSAEGVGVSLTLTDGPFKYRFDFQGGPGDTLLRRPPREWRMQERQRAIEEGALDEGAVEFDFWRPPSAARLEQVSVYSHTRRLRLKKRYKNIEEAVEDILDAVRLNNPRWDTNVFYSGGV